MCACVHDFKVPHSHDEGGTKLGVWIKNQRVAAKAGELSARRRRRLADLGVRLQKPSGKKPRGDADTRTVSK